MSREAFEKAMAHPFMSIQDIARNWNGSAYESDFLQGAWTGWQAALESQSRRPPLAKDHTGMRMDAAGLLLRVPGPLKFGAQSMHRHLNELAQRFYSGDIAVVDEFLQLYCLDEHRPNGQEVHNA